MTVWDIKPNELMPNSITPTLERLTSKQSRSEANQNSSMKGTNEMTIKDKPAQGKIYCLFGGKGEPSIAKGNTWAESEVKEDKEEKENL